MRWPFSKSKPTGDQSPAARIKDIRIAAAYLGNDDLINCIVVLVSDRRFTTDQRSRLFLRLGGKVVAEGKPKPPFPW